MKKHIILIGYLLFINCVLIGQNLSEAEYFFDADPGIGNGTSISMTEGDTVNFIFDTDVSGLSEGFHTLFVRFKNSSNIWSLYEGRTFYIQPEYEIEQTASIRQAEYFFDADPGIGNGTSISITEGDTVNFIFDADVSGLSEGFHTLFVRIKNDQEWSLYEGRTFYIQPEYEIEQTASIKQAEYFFDADPGIGNGTSISITEGDTVNFIFDTDISALSEGFHTLFVRFKNDHEWSLYEGRTFYIQSKSVTQNSSPIAALEYFIGDDPGIGNGTTLELNSADTINENFSIDLSDYDLGTYSISVRAKNTNNTWSIALADTFRIVDCDIPDKPAPPAGPVMLCENDPDTVYFINKVNYADSYEWEISPQEAGTVTGNDTIASINWNNTYVGLVQIKVRGVNNCISGAYSDPLNININSYPIAIINNDTTICQGEAVELIASGGTDYIWSTQEVNDTIIATPDETNTYSVTVTENTCSDTAEVTVHVSPVYDIEKEAAICNGENYVFGSQTLIESGEYLEVFETILGCDSVVTLNLTVNPIYNETDSVSICSGESYIFGTQTLTEAGEYIEIFESLLDCDSSVTLILTVNPIYSYFEEQSICKGDTFYWHGEKYTESDIYYTEYNSINGCDSIYELDLTVFDLPSTPIISQNGDTLISNTEMGNHWYLNNSEISGANEQKYIPISEGDYFVIIIDDNGCSSLHSNIINISFTGYNSLDNINIQVYPNPTRDILHIKNQTNEYLVIEIFDLTGSLIKDYIITNQHGIINVEELETSLYLMKISYNDKIYTLKFLKE